MHERNPRLRVAPGAHPAFDRDRHVLRRLAGEDLMPAELSLVHRSYRIDGVPSWTRIEPCASLRNRNFGGCSSKPETCQSRHSTIGRQPFVNTPLATYPHHVAFR